MVWHQGETCAWLLRPSWGAVVADSQRAVPVRLLQLFVRQACELRECCFSHMGTTDHPPLYRQLLTAAPSPPPALIAPTPPPCVLLLPVCCRYMGKGVSKAVENVNTIIAPAVIVSA